jgi:hypothetical protein
MLQVIEGKGVMRGRRRPAVGSFCTGRLRRQGRLGFFEKTTHELHGEDSRRVVYLGVREAGKWLPG